MLRHAPHPTPPHRTCTLHYNSQGLDEVKEKYEHVEIIKNEHYAADPSGLRTGNGPGPQLAATLEQVATAAEQYCDKSQVRLSVQ